MFNFQNFQNILKKTYLISYETENWNYYDNIENITNNVLETFNKYLKNYLQKNQLFFNYYRNCKKNPNITLITKGELLEF